MAFGRPFAWMCELSKPASSASLWGRFSPSSRQSCRRLSLSYDVAVTPISKTYMQRAAKRYCLTRPALPSTSLGEKLHFVLPNW